MQHHKIFLFHIKHLDSHHKVQTESTSNPSIFNSANRTRTFYQLGIQSCILHYKFLSLLQTHIFKKYFVFFVTQTEYMWMAVNAEAIPKQNPVVPGSIICFLCICILQELIVVEKDWKTPQIINWMLDCKHTNKPSIVRGILVVYNMYSYTKSNTHRNHSRKISATTNKLKVCEQLYK